jgi:hypothetical protein
MPMRGARPESRGFASDEPGGVPDYPLVVVLVVGNAGMSTGTLPLIGFGWPIPEATVLVLAVRCGLALPPSTSHRPRAE